MKEPHRRKRHRQKLSKRDILIASRGRWVASLPQIELTYTETFGHSISLMMQSWINLVR